MEMDSSDKRGRVRKKSAKAREMEEFEEEERKHGGKKPSATVAPVPLTPPPPIGKKPSATVVSVPSSPTPPSGKKPSVTVAPVPSTPPPLSVKKPSVAVLPVPSTPPPPTKKAKVKIEPASELDMSPVSKGVTSPGLKPSVSPASGASSPDVKSSVSPRSDPQTKASVIKLLLSSPVQQSPPPGGKAAKSSPAQQSPLPGGKAAKSSPVPQSPPSGGKAAKSSPVPQNPPSGGKATKKEAAKTSDTKTGVKGRKLNIGDSEDVTSSPLKRKLNVVAGASSTHSNKVKSAKVEEELPPLCVDTNVQSETIGDEGSLKMKFILSPKEKASDSSKKSVNLEQSSNQGNQGIVTMLKSGSMGGEKRKILKTKRTDIDSETNEATGCDTVAKVVKKAVKRKVEQTVIVKTNPSSSVEYSLPADQNLDYMDLSSFDFDEEGELIISEDNKTKKLTKKLIKSSPKKAKQSADNEFSLDDSQLASSDVAELAKRVKTAAQKKMGKKVKKGKGQKEEAPSQKEEKKKRAPTAYLLWCHSYRHKVVAETPGADFVHISKRLGELWQNLPEKEKLAWRNKARKNAGKGSTLISTGKTGGSRTGPPPGITSQTHPTTTTTPTPTIVKLATPTASKTKQSADDPLSPIKGFGTEPVDVAAHLKLVGESLCIIGVRLQEHRGLIAVQGSLSVLLDSMLCALGPLMCLTQQLPQLDGCPDEVHAKTLDNVAYIMPGL